MLKVTITPYLQCLPILPRGPPFKPSNVQRVMITTYLQCLPILPRGPPFKPSNVQRVMITTYLQCLPILPRGPTLNPSNVHQPPAVLVNLKQYSNFSFLERDAAFCHVSIVTHSYVRLAQFLCNKTIKAQCQPTTVIKRATLYGGFHTCQNLEIRNRDTFNALTPTLSPAADESFPSNPAGSLEPKNLGKRNWISKQIDSAQCNLQIHQSIDKTFLLNLQKNDLEKYWLLFLKTEY